MDREQAILNEHKKHMTSVKRLSRVFYAALDDEQKDVFSDMFMNIKPSQKRRASKGAKIAECAHAK